VPSPRPLLNLANLKVYHPPQQLLTTNHTKHLAVRFSACTPSSGRHPSISRWDAFSKFSSIRPTFVCFLPRSKDVAVQRKQQPHPSIPPLPISASEHTYSCLEAAKFALIDLDFGRISNLFLPSSSLPIRLTRPSLQGSSMLVDNINNSHPSANHPTYVISVPDPT
jgi:hypothetical protein